MLSCAEPLAAPLPPSAEDALATIASSSLGNRAGREWTEAQPSSWSNRCCSTSSSPVATSESIIS